MSVFDSGPVLLDTPEKMFAVLRELSGGDALTWRGSVECWGEGVGQSAKWRLRVNDDKSNKISSRIDLQEGVLIGEYLVLTYGRLLVLDASEV
ncbi:hypothetical protein [Mycolicibacterium setense]|uniref:hypothetical protein n=1 Tax=Mycolicibacterium setense TaxID=431269 RepID=UPI000A7D10D3|nr:hypothetical protein [Mycolicibacterium setense]